MKHWLLVLNGLGEIRANRLRNILTALGVALGVASLLTSLALTAGMARGMRESMNQVGGVERVGVLQKAVPLEQELLADTSPGRTLADVEAIRNSAPLVARVSPLTDLHSCVLERDGHSVRTLVNGVSPEYLPMTKHVVELGRPLAELDLDRASPVCVMGRRIVDQLWPNQDNYNPVGETITLNGHPFRVVGVFQFYESEEDKRRRSLLPTDALPGRAGRTRGGTQGRNFFADRKNTTVLIPVSTMLVHFKSATIVNNQDQGPNHKLDNIIFQVADMSRFEGTLDQVATILNITHRGVDDFDFETREESFAAMERVVRNAQLSGGLVAAISLVAAGIGIMNIMLASVAERVREIGVRMAVGARSSDILVQILVESAALGAIGGVVGLGASAGIMKLLIAASPVENAPIVDVSSVLLSFSFAVITAIISGFYPALKASRLKPVEALRYG